MSLAELAALIPKDMPPDAKFSLPASLWLRFVPYISPWAIVPATENAPPSFWFLGVRVHQHRDS